ncbi:MAG: glycosyltransferase, partial [Firmicutes bacterium]|nr:glycosyltransferase [Bacillota bacterium]
MAAPRKNVALSLCVIARDEEAALPECLAGMAGVAGQIIVVDTGSRDATAETARRLGAEVLHHPWREDFASARNAALEAARGNWVLFLDADERIFPEDIPSIAPLLRRRSKDGFFLEIHSPLGTGPRSDIQIIPRFRLFRRRPELRFEGRIHEQILPSLFRLKPVPAIDHAGVRILHLGYLPGARREERLRQNLALLRQEILEKPEDGFPLFNLGCAYLESDRFAEALACFKQAAPLAPRGISYRSLLARNTARCLAELGDGEKAMGTVRAGLEEFPDYPDLHLLEGELALASGRASEASAAFHRCLLSASAPVRHPSSAGALGFKAWEGLGDARAAAGAAPQALEAYRKAFILQASRRHLVAEKAARMAAVSGSHVLRSFLNAGDGARDLFTAAVLARLGDHWPSADFLEVMEAVHGLPVPIALVKALQRRAR